MKVTNRGTSSVICYTHRGASVAWGSQRRTPGPWGENILAQGLLGRTRGAPGAVGNTRETIRVLRKIQRGPRDNGGDTDGHFGPWGRHRGAPVAICESHRALVETLEGYQGPMGKQRGAQVALDDSQGCTKAVSRHRGASGVVGGHQEGHQGCGNYTIWVH